MKIQVTLERTQRVCMEFDADEEQIKSLKNGDNPFHGKLLEALPAGDEEFDYAVDDEQGRTIVPWQT